MRPVCSWLGLLMVGLPGAASYKGIFDYTPPLVPVQRLDGSGDLQVPMMKCNGIDLEEATIDDLQRAMNDSRLSSVQLVSCYFVRNFQTQPYINSLLQFNVDAFAIAHERDVERANGNWRGPLHGIPFTVKDNIATNDNLETTAGSWALVGSQPPRDAFVVQQLRNKGAVLLGKAAMSEWADMRSLDYSEGYSARGGQCRSPYNLSVNPGGSSSGSGVGVAANTIAFSLGTETDGSIVNPAMRNSIVGFKPTVGLTSRAGVIPESEHQDSVGTFGRTVKDAVLALDAIYGIDENDPYTLGQKGKAPEGGYVQFLTDRRALSQMTFGIPWDSFWTKTDVESRTVLLQMLARIRDAGARIVNKTEITDHETIVSPAGWDWEYGTSNHSAARSEYTYVKVDFYNNINQYLGQLKNTRIRSLEDLVQYNKENAGSEGGLAGAHPAFASGQDGFLNSLATSGQKDETYRQALDFCQSSTRTGIRNALRHHQGTTLTGLLVPLEPGQSYQIAAQAGFPIIAVPAGIHAQSHMGIGLGILQAAWGEPDLVRAASAIEDLTRNTPHQRQRPRWRGYWQRNLPVPF